MSTAVGRYAPSPTGRLHFGSLIAAVASFCQARAQGGRWLLRIDDLDTPRVVRGADIAILETLAAFGLRHDGVVLYQSERLGAYTAAIERLKRSALAFDCGCTRREARAGPPGIEGPIYPGTCRAGLRAGRTPRSIRLKVSDTRIELADLYQGRYSQNLAAEIGDFVIRRADGVTAYQLATVLDDAEQGVNEVVRGADLLSSTPRQMWIHRCLGLAVPRYAHVPIIVDDAGEKLGKRNGALGLDPSARQAQWIECLALLGQRPPASLASRSVSAIVHWAVDNWEPAAVPKRRTSKRMSLAANP